VLHTVIAALVKVRARQRGVGGGMASTPGDPEREPSGLWRAVLAALESNGKTARLVVIILALGLVITMGTHFEALP
jgi:hypothetical protein